MDDLPELEDGPERAARVSGCLFMALAAVLVWAIAGVTAGFVVIQMTVLAVLAFGLGVAMLLLGAEPTVLLAAVVTGLASLGLWSLYLVQGVASDWPAAGLVFFAVPALLSLAATVAAVIALARRAR